ncbi:hypothetical protein ISS05_01160 [Candidatus Woesearchaeota archaeon]|nr:hypothetical protein [Candidatus Woesearchaeota archaeon]
MKKVAKFGILALLLVSLVASAFAFSGRGFGNEAARDALESGDYVTWKNAMIAELTQENFNQMAERHSQMGEKRAVMMESREQRYEGMAEKRAAMQEKKTEIESAMQEGYEAWVEAVGDSPRAEKLLEVINSDNFDIFVDMHEAKQNKDFETAKELAEELGLKNPGFNKGHKPRNYFK